MKTYRFTNFNSFKDRQSKTQMSSTTRLMQINKTPQTRHLIVGQKKLAESLPRAQSKVKINQRSPAVRQIDLDKIDNENDIYNSQEVNSVPTPMIYGASPVNSDYDSDRLQNELNNLKDIRKKYGPQWLISSHNMGSKKADHSYLSVENNDKFLSNFLQI